MRGWRTRLERIALRHAESVMPEGRQEWTRAMAAELDHLPERDRLSFAIGCVSSSYRERLTDPATLLAAGRALIILGLYVATAVCLRTAALLPAGNPSALVFALGLICVGAAVAFVRWGFCRLPMVAVTGFAAALLALLVLGEADALTGGATPSSLFYRAILLEQSVAWAALFWLARGLLAVQVRHRANG